MSQDILGYSFTKQLQSLPYVDEIWLFGSRARGDHQPRSDIDLAILCPRATDVEWLKLLDIIEDADTLLKIDCVRFEKERINAELYQNILRDKKVIYVKNRDKT